MLAQVIRLCWVVVVLAVAGLGACGGGSGNNFGNNGNAGDGATGAGKVTVTLSVTTVTAALPATVTVKVTNANGQAVASQVVTIATDSGLGSLSAGSALTGIDGTTQFLLFAKSGAINGADNVTVTTNIGGTIVTGKAGFSVAATSASIASFTSDVAIGNSLGAYGQSILSATINGTASGTPVGLSISSVCLSQGKATITPASQTVTTGTATFTYVDQGCGANLARDDITLSIAGTTTSSATSLALASPAVGSITFAGATPSTIFLKGSGFVESSNVSFLVVDNANNPLPNQSVDLKLSSGAGGLTIDGLVSTSTVNKKSDSTGKVSVLINSGTVPTPVRVQATLSGINPVIGTVSSTLAVAVGLPSQLNFSLSQGTLNIEGMNSDGTTNTYSVIASDRMANPVPSGTAINFVAEGGQIEPIKQVEVDASGLSRVTANFITASPRPANGRITVVAYALGEESFLDQNGNNVFDNGEPFQDLGNVYVDRKFDASYDPTDDQSIATTSFGAAACAVTASPLLVTDASIPSVPGTCDTGWGRAYVRRATETVLSTSAARPVWASNIAASLDSSCAVENLFTESTESARTKFYRVGDGGLYNLPASGIISFLASDANAVRLNPMAAGSTVSATIRVPPTGSGTANVEGGSPIPSTLSAGGVTLSYSLANTTGGTIFITFQSPSGLRTTVSLPISTQGPSTACVL